MTYNFDEIIDRVGTNSIKYEQSRMEEPDLPEDFIPLWIADMDFACAPKILEAMRKRLDCRVLGYSDILQDDYYKVLEKWMKQHFDWNMNWKNLRISAGVVPAVSNLVQILTARGDKILITTPSYGPFFSIITNNERIPVYSPLVKQNDHYELDFDDLEQKIIKEDIKLFVFCSPHNPTGRVWSEKELRTIVEICEKHEVPIICDEIHQDLTRKGVTHIPMSKLYPEADWIYTCTAPSKTFNMAGNHLANIFIPKDSVRAVWDDKFYYLPNPLSIAATQAAYGECGDWVTQLNEYIDNNFILMKKYFEKYLPQIEFEIPEGTYLAWFNMKNTGFSMEEIKERFIKMAGLHIEDGTMFVDNGDYYIRMNMACPRSIIETALERMRKVFGTQ